MHMYFLYLRKQSIRLSTGCQFWKGAQINKKTGRPNDLPVLHIDILF